METRRFKMIKTDTGKRKANEDIFYEQLDTYENLASSSDPTSNLLCDIIHAITILDVRTMRGANIDLDHHLVRARV